MKKYIFTGTVHPERAWVTIPPFEAEIFRLNSEPLGKVRVSIGSSQIALSIKLEDDNIDVVTLKNSIQVFLEKIICIFDFVKGYHHYVDLKQCIDELGNAIVFGVDHPAVSERLEITGNEFFNIYNITSDVDGFLVSNSLSDLSKAIQCPFDTAFYCFRAIESLKNYFKNSNNDKPAWKTLAETVQMTKDDIDIVKKYSDNQRHGVHQDMSGNDRDEILRISFKIVDRFVNYLLEKKGIAFRLTEKVV